MTLTRIPDLTDPRRGVLTLILTLTLTDRRRGSWP